MEADFSLPKPTLTEQIDYCNRKIVAHTGFPEAKIYAAMKENLVGLRMVEEAEKRDALKVTPNPETVATLAKQDPLI